MKRRHGSKFAALLLGAATCFAPAAAPAQTDSGYAFDVPAQDLGTALRQVAATAGLELYASAADLQGLKGPALKGRMSARQAVAILLRDTRLTAEFEAGALIVRARAEPAAGGGDRPDQAIVVTGTLIRGAKSPSPIIAITRDDFGKAGQNDLGEVVRAIPQNFGGGQNPGVGSGAGLTNGNLNSSSHLNLRGLGADATLTLLNGHRLPYDGAFGGVDISAIPTEAVERIEILPDGASAQYGSDAVAGVANVILRRDFEGLATSVRIGAATSGGNFQQGADAVAGTRWRTGGVMLAYQFARNSGIAARQRDFAGSLPQGNSVYPAIRQHSLLLSGRQELGDGVSFRIDGLFSDRRSRTVGGNLSAAGLQRILFAPSARTFSISPELGIELGSDWMARASLAYGENDTRFDTAITPPGGAESRTNGCYCNGAFSAELVFDGPVLTLPGGDIRIAFGGGYRSNKMRYSQFRNGAPAGAFDVSRDSHYVFGEAEIPVIGPEQDLAFLRRLVITGAARHESYPGMASVTTPKLGFVYEPDANLAFKASWGRSFKAPTLYQQYVGYETYLLPAAAYGAAPSGTIVYASGGNPDLRPERARSWSAGVEFHPVAVDGLRLSASYFDVRYSDRVAQPIAGSIASAFSDPGYANLLYFAPAATDLAALISGSLYGLTNFADEPYDPAAVAAIVDNRNRNIARQDIEGVDIDLSYIFALDRGNKLHLAGSAAWLKSEQRLDAALPSSILAGTIYNPPHWRARASASWQSEGLTLSAFANYVGKVSDTRFDPAPTVASRWTIDLAALVDVGGDGKGEPLFDLTLTVNNLFNQKPDIIRTRGSSDTPYDSTNFSPIGRFIGMKVSRKW